MPLLKYIKKFNDLRFRILEYFEELDNSTSEEIANPWLETQDDDLGTIKRSLIDLIESDFIRLSSLGDKDPIKWLNENWDSTTHGKRTKEHDDKKSSKRLTQDVGIHNKVPDVKMYTTVKGLMFIKEYRRFKYHYYWIIGTAILSFLLGLATHYLTQS